MTLQQLEYVVALDNYRHFVTAAEQSYVTQPTLTMQLQKLEEEIGIKIFDRSTKPLKPTAAGELIVLKARQILREVSQMKELVSTEKESLEGEFTIGIIPTLAPYLLPLFLPEFTKKHPKTYLKIQELQTEQIINQLNNGRIDVGLLVTPLEERSIREVPLFYEPFLLYLPDNHHFIQSKSLKPEFLDSGQVLILDEGHCFREQALVICNHREAHSKVGFSYQSGSIEALKGLVKRGIGYTLVPELSVLEEMNKSYVKRFDAPEPVREVSIVVHNGFAKEALIEQLREVIIQTIPERFKKTTQFTRVKWR